MFGSTKGLVSQTRASRKEVRRKEARPPACDGEGGIPAGVAARDGDGERSAANVAASDGGGEVRPELLLAIEKREAQPALLLWLGRGGFRSAPLLTPEK